MDTEGSIDKIEVDQDMDKIIEMTLLKVTQEHIKILKDRIVEKSTGLTRNRDRNRCRERSLSRNPNYGRNYRSLSNGRSRSGSGASTKSDRIRCYKCREYDHLEETVPHPGKKGN